MKKCLFLLSFIISISAFSQSNSLSSSNNDQGNTIQTIVCITHNDPVIMEKVRATMTSMAGTNVVAYCDNHAVFMVEIDKTVYQDANAFLHLVKKYTSGAELLLSLKEGDFSVIDRHCEPSDANDAAKLKQTFTN